MKKDLLLLLAYTFFWFLIDFILQINQNRTFTLVDDHTIISTLNFLSQHTPLSYIKEVLNDSERFRPLLGIHRLFYTLLFGTNIKLIGYYYLVLAGITSFFLHKFAELIGFSKREAIIFTILVLFGMQGVIWWVFDSSENIGILFMSIALFSGHKAFYEKTNYMQVLFWISLFFMSLSKESFVFILPFFAVLYKQISWASVLILLICCIEILYIKFFIGTTFGYAGVDENTYSITNVMKVVVQYLIRGYGLPLLFVIIYLLFQHRNLIKGYLYENRLYILIIVVGIFPFLLLYSKSGLNVGRYLLPLLIPQFYVLFNLTKQITDTRVKTGVIGIVVVLFSYHCIKFFQIQRDFTKENKVLAAFYMDIQKNTAKNDDILLMVNPVEDFEKAGALMIYMKSKFSLDREKEKMAIVDLDEYKPTEQVYQLFLNFNRANLKEDNKPIGSYKKWIVVNDKVLENLKKRAYLPQPYRIKSQGEYSIISFD